MRTIYSVLLLLAVLNSSEAADKHKTVAHPQAQASQSQQSTSLDTAPLEKAIRESIKEASEKEPADAEKHLKNEGQLVKDTSELALQTHRLAKFTLWLVCATGIMGAIVFGQLCMFWRQLGLMEVDSQSTKDAAAAAKASADAANAQAASLISAERAYVNISHVQPGIVFEGSVGSVTLEVKNWGKTPGTVTSVRSDAVLLEYDERLPIDFPYRRAPDDEAAAAFLVPSAFYIALLNFPVREKDAPQVRGGKRLWLFGHVDYIDVFGGRYRAGWVRTYEPARDGTNNNLRYATGGRYNYDRPRQKGEGNDWGE